MNPKLYPNPVLSIWYIAISAGLNILPIKENSIINPCHNPLQNPAGSLVIKSDTCGDTSAHPVNNTNNNRNNNMNNNFFMMFI